MPADARTTEVGGQFEIGVALRTRPTANVVVPIVSSDPSEGSITVSSLTFTRDNWNAPQIVTVTGVDDDVADGNQTYSLTLGAATSDDDAFAGLEGQSGEIVNIDDETPGVVLGIASGDTREDGGQATFTVVLQSEPTADVTVALASDDLTEGTTSPATLTFTVANWNAPQTVTVTGVNDDLEDGTIDYTASVTGITSTDTRYAAVSELPSVSLSNIDDDTAGITVGAISGDTDEDGEQATFTVRLNSQPTGNVTVHFDTDDATEGTLTATSLAFTTENWAAPQTVTVTGADDDVADGNQVFHIAFSATTSTDSAYAAITPDDVTVTNVDDDSPGISVSAISGDTSEEGDQATFTVVLTSEPTGDVTVHFGSDDTTEGTLTVSSLTFTSDNWDAPQTVTVTGANDDLADGNQGYQIDFTATTSTDAAYAAITPANVDVTNVDDETAGFEIGAVSGPTDEDGGQATFTIRLTSEPTADVTVHFDSDDTTEGTITVTSLTFTSDNWDAEQTVTVTGVNDDVADGDQGYQIDFTATTSADPDYAAIMPVNVDLTNDDDDSAGITVSAIDADTTEGGAQASFTIVLDSEPTADVTVHFDSDDVTEGTLTATSLTFTSDNWDAPQTVTVTGVNDDVADGDQGYEIDFTATTSADATYAAITPGNVDVTNQDDDAAGITVSAITGNTNEGGAQAGFTIVLDSEPTADVTVHFDTDDATEGTVTATSLTFTSDNWDAPQTVLITGANDDVADGDQGYQIDFTATTSSDTAYAAITPDNVDVTNEDDDSAGITVSAISGDTTEDGDQASFTVVLDSEPTADVTVHFDTDDNTEGTVTVTSLTFTSDNWDAPQTVTVTGANDFVADGDQGYQIDFSATTSTDAAYAAITPGNVDVVNQDDDSAGITVSAIDGDTSEGGDAASFTVVLDSQPTADVTVSFDTDDATEGTVNVTSLLFTSDNWNAPQTVTVTGEDDFVADGDQGYQIDFTATTSSDAAYAAITPGNVDVTNTDDDSAGITVSPISGHTTEAGGTATFTVVLNSQPTANVTVRFASDDTTEGTTNVTSLVFTAGDWMTPKVVTITGVNDFLDDGNQAYQIDFMSTLSSDAAYAAITPMNIDVINDDNDTAGISFGTISGNTTEAGGFATVSVVLTSQPTASVTINYNTSDSTEGVPVSTTLTFTTGNWNVPQQLRINGVDDFVQDGNQPYRIDFTPTASLDPAYAAITPASINVVNVDNDNAGYVVSAISGPTSEQGSTATFTIRLASQPTSNVTVSFNSNDTTEGTVNVTTFTFTAGDWNFPRTVIVTGVNDMVSDPSTAYQIVFTPSTSADPLYSGTTPPPVSVLNIEVFRSCAELLALVPGTPSGTYFIDADLGGPLPTRSSYCDMVYQGGGWTNLNFAANRIVLENGIVVQCNSLTASGNQIVCDHPKFSANQWLYHYRCDGGDTSGNWVLDHIGPIIGHRAFTAIGGFTSLSQNYIDDASQGDQEFCYINGQTYHYTSPMCSPYNAPGNGNCAMNVFRITH